MEKTNPNQESVEEVQKNESALSVRIDNEIPIATVEALVIEGDISKLTAKEKVDYYLKLCSSLGLNPAASPFQVIKFKGKEVLYATKSCTEQLRKIWKVSVTKMTLTLDKELNVAIATAELVDSSGKTDIASGAVPLVYDNGKLLNPTDMSNAVMKAETKAKRRGTLSICGLGFLDESELDTMPQHQTYTIDPVNETVIETEHKHPQSDASMFYRKKDGEVLVNDDAFDPTTKTVDFGKHKGQLWISLPVDYLKWLRGINNINGKHAGLTLTALNHYESAVKEKEVTLNDIIPPDNDNLDAPVESKQETDDGYPF